MSEQPGTIDQSYVQAGPDEPALLAAFGIDEQALLGAGGEARVFALDVERVLRVQAPGEAPPQRDLADLLNTWTDADVGFELPRVQAQGRHGAQNYSIERRLSGIPLSRWLAKTSDPRHRRRALLSLLDASERLRELPLPRLGFGRVLADQRAFDSLTGLLAAQIEIGLAHGGVLLAGAVPDLDDHVRRLLHRLAARTVAPVFCHGDLAASNVLADADGRVTAVLDISGHALAADPVLDQVGAVAFLEMIPYAGNTEDAAWLQRELAGRLGDDAWLIDAYRRFFALYYAMDPGLIPWCAAQLRAPEASPAVCMSTTRRSTPSGIAGTPE